MEYNTLRYNKIYVFECYKIHIHMWMSARSLFPCLQVYFYTDMAYVFSLFLPNMFILSLTFDYVKYRAWYQLSYLTLALLLHIFWRLFYYNAELIRNSQALRDFAFLLLLVSIGLMDWNDSDCMNLMIISGSLLNQIASICVLKCPWQW